MESAAFECCGAGQFVMNRFNRQPSAVATCRSGAPRSGEARSGETRIVLHALLSAILLVVLAGCAAQAPTPRPTAEPPVAPDTWQQIDYALVAASQEAREQAADYAEDLMQRWRKLVLQRTDEHFIPWFSSNWTQQWLGMRVTWYRLDSAETREPAAARLALYLQTQYQARVLEPVARQIHPGWVTEQATRLYVHHLGGLVRDIPLRYGVPAGQFDEHLRGIPAIPPAPSDSGVSLHALLHSDPLDRLPAYATFVERIRAGQDGTDAWSADAGIAALARQASTDLSNEQTTQGIVGMLSTVVGRVAGMTISLGATAFTSLAREERRPNMESQLRQNLHATFEAQWLELMHAPDSGVLAGVRHLSGQIEGTLAERLAQTPRHTEQASPAAPLPALAPLPPDAGEAPYLLW